MKFSASLILIIGFLAPSISAKAIVPLEDPYVWRHELLWDSQTKASLALSFKESGDLIVNLRIGSWNHTYAKQMPILAASCSINVFNEFIFAKYAAGLNLWWVSGVVTGNTDGEFQYLLNNWIFADEKVAFGGSILGDKLKIKKFGAVLNTFGVHHKDDPEQWRDSILWNEKSPLSFYARYENGGELAGGLTLGVSNNLMPTATVAVSSDLNDVLNGNYWNNLRYSAQLNHDFLQAVVAGNQTDLKYLIVPKVVRADEQTGDEKASVGGIVQGEKSTLTNAGATVNIFGILIDALANSEWTNVKEIFIDL